MLNKDKNLYEKIIKIVYFIKNYLYYLMILLVISFTNKKQLNEMKQAINKTLFLYFQMLNGQGYKA